MAHLLTKVAAGVGLLVLLGGCSSSLTSEPGSSDTGDEASVVSEAPDAPPVETGTGVPQGVSPDGRIAIGQETAPVTVTVLSDFRCPACQAFEQENGAQLDQLVAAGTVQVEYVPVSILDNFSAGTRYSTRAAGAAYCVAESDRAVYGAFQDALYEDQPREDSPGPTTEDLVTTAVDVGVSPAGQACISEERYTAFATSVTRQAADAGMVGTPTVYLNGHQIGDLSAANLATQINTLAQTGTLPL